MTPANPGGKESMWEWRASAGGRDSARDMRSSVRDIRGSVGGRDSARDARGGAVGHIHRQSSSAQLPSNHGGRPGIVRVLSGIVLKPIESGVSVAPDHSPSNPNSVTVEVYVGAKKAEEEAKYHLNDVKLFE